MLKRLPCSDCVSTRCVAAFSPDDITLPEEDTMWLLHGMDQASGMLLEMHGATLDEPLTYLDSLANTSTALTGGSLRQMTLDSMLTHVQPSDAGEDIPIEFHPEDDPERLLAGQVLCCRSQNFRPRMHAMWQRRPLCAHEIDVEAVEMGAGIGLEPVFASCHPSAEFAS
jgi:hypothetical protein